MPFVNDDIFGQNYSPDREYAIIIPWIGGAALYFVGPGLQYSGYDKGESCKAQCKTKGKLNIGLQS